MTKKTKHLCKYDKKEINDQLDYIWSLIQSPAYMCEKCTRSANISNVLCKPIPMEFK